MSELVITKWQEHLTILGFAQNKLQLLTICDMSERLGNVYVGRVENTVANLNSVFVRFEKSGGKHGVGFLPIKSIPVQCILNRKVSDSKEIRPGDLVLVQIKTEEQKTKQAKLTGRIKLSSDEFNGDIEQLIQTAACRTEYQILIDRRSDIVSLVTDAVERLKKLSGQEQSSIDVITDIVNVYDKLKDNIPSCVFYDEEKQGISLFIHYSITGKTEDILKKRVWLSSGAYLVVEQTETLNLIDVNSGKNLKKSDAFILEQNKEAAVEAYRQIRLRNLTGMILIDFISMKGKEADNELISFIENMISDDHLHMRFIDMTALGIMEFTRDKNMKTIREILDFSKM